MAMDGSKDAPIVYTDGDETKTHTCADPGTVAASRLTDWVDRQIVRGALSPSERAAFERAIEDIRAGG